MRAGFEYINERTPNLIPDNDSTGIPVVIGPCSAGPINTVKKINNKSDLAQFGAGRAVELAAMISNRAGNGFFFCRSITSTPSTIGTITKTYGNPVGTPINSFASVLVAGATVNGDIVYAPKQVGVNLTVVNPGVLTPATVIAVVGQAITITLKHDGVGITETATALVAAIAANVNASPLLLATAQGTGASAPGALASTALTDNYFQITALASGISYRVLVSGTNTAFSTSYAAGVVTVTAATNASGEPTTTMTTALASLQALAIANPNTFSVTNVGTVGTKLIAAKAVTTLPYGSTGTMTATGTPTDQFDFIVTMTKAGTVGGPTPLIVTWSPDGGKLYSSTATGVVNPDGTYTPIGTNLPTGLLLTFSGSFDVGDSFSFATTEPLTSPADLATSVDTCLNTQVVDGVIKYKPGFLTSAIPVNKSTALALDAKLQEKYQQKTCAALWTVRDFNPGETHDQWQASITTDFAGFISYVGLTSVAATPGDIQSPYTGRALRVPYVFFAAPQIYKYSKEKSLAMTEGEFATNPFYTAIYHDERLQPGLDDARFVTGTTYEDSEIVGAIYTTDGLTFGDPTDLSVGSIQYSRIRRAIFRALGKALFTEIGKQVIINPFTVGAKVAGSIRDDAKNRIIALCKKTLNPVLFKSGEQAVSALSIDIPQDYSLAATRILKLNVIATVLGEIKNIIITVALDIPVG